MPGKGRLFRALHPNGLRQSVKDGIQAMERGDREHIDTPARRIFTDSVALDAFYKRQAPNASRWDYILGASGSRLALTGIEVHPAIPREVSAVIDKARWARERMAMHLQEGEHVARWFWIASGSDGLLRSGTDLRRLSNAGITYVGSRLRGKDLDGP